MGSVDELEVAPLSKLAFRKKFCDLRGGMAVWIKGLPFLRTVLRLAMDPDQRCSAGAAIVMSH